MLAYPVITTGQFAHRGSFQYLLGSQAHNQAMLDKLSIEKHIDAKTPPVFVWHTMTDAGVPVENTLMLIQPAVPPVSASKHTCSPKGGMVYRWAMRRRHPTETVNPSSNVCNVGRNWPKLGCVVCFSKTPLRCAPSLPRGYGIIAIVCTGSSCAGVHNRAVRVRQPGEKTRRGQG